MIPADQSSNYYNDLADQTNIINAKNELSSSITPVFFDNFNTPEGLPSDSNYFNGYSNTIFDDGQNPFSNYNKNNNNSLIDCNTPASPTFPSFFQSGSNQFNNLFNVGVFNQSLKQSSILQKSGSFPIIDMFKQTTNTIGTSLKNTLSPISGFLKSISNCLKKL